ncbi:hypothetical protein [uncultured Kordia sp.]|uniref:hypothetical protein n=1 Tax=uncultured Kordia sp. TaxID=507699 RepID=UPI0026310EAC|nr:hypothetical protein [uncultured Kordia sp.]
MRKPLKLKKIKISKVGNLHEILAGALPAQAAGAYPTLPDTLPVTYTLDTKLDDTCQSHTNDGGTLVRTRGNIKNPFEIASN